MDSCNTLSNMNSFSNQNNKLERKFTKKCSQNIIGLRKIYSSNTAMEFKDENRESKPRNNNKSLIVLSENCIEKLIICETKNESFK